MPTLTEHDMQRIAFSILHAAGAPEAHAKTVSDHLSWLICQVMIHMDL